MANRLMEHSLWTVETERGILTDSMFANIYCNNCGYTEKTIFRGSSTKCPQCGVTELGVSEFNQRNALVADNTERFAVTLFDYVINHSPHLMGKFFVKRNVECRQLELSGRTKADIAILNQDIDTPVLPEMIECIFEVKMSLIWNWSETNRERPLADYDRHAGRPSIYRTDSILKAIGKAAVTRSCLGSERIPFIVVGNTPPPVTYRDKVDGTVKAGLIQRWISLTPSPLVVEPSKSPQNRNPKSTLGFERIDSLVELEKLFIKILTVNWRYVGAMVEVKKIGEIIRALDLSQTCEKIGETFLRQLASPMFR